MTDGANKTGKTPFHLVPLEFVANMARVMEAGLQQPGRYPGSWKELDPAKLPEYRSAILRHLRQEEEDGPLALDPDSGWPALAHVATSAMICWRIAQKASAAPAAREGSIDERDKAVAMRYGNVPNLDAEGDTPLTPK